MKGWEPRVARRTVEENHVAHHALGIEHAGQEVAAELAVQLGGAGHGVGTVNAEVALQSVGRAARAVRREEVGVRVSSGSGPDGAADFSVEDHLLPLV